MRFSKNAALAIPATTGNPSTQTIEVKGARGATAISVAFSDALPTSGKIVVGILKDGGDPTQITDFLDLAVLTAPSTVSVAKGATVVVYGRSGGSAGTVNVTVVAG